jgi:hypothetical protein
MGAGSACFAFICVHLRLKNPLRDAGNQPLTLIYPAFCVSANFGLGTLEMGLPALLRVHWRSFAVFPSLAQCKKRRAGQQVRPFHTDAPENQCINNGTTIPDPGHPTSHQNW